MQNIYFSLKPVFIEQLNTDEMISFLKKYEHQIPSNMQFRKFQVKFIESEKKIIFLETPTSSGKTLAAIGRVLLRNNQAKAIFFYPTNELAREQVFSISGLVNLLGFDTEIVDPYCISTLSENNYISWQSDLMKKLINEKPKKVIIINIDGEILFDFLDAIEELENTSQQENRTNTKGKLIYSLLNAISDSNVPCIICTNLDFLFLILTNRYKKSKRIWEILIKWNNIIIDEFHLYSGIQFFYLLLMIIIYFNTIKDVKNSWISFLSATPTIAKDLFKDSFPGLVDVIITDVKNFQDNSNWTKIKCESLISFKKSSNILNIADIDILLIPIIKKLLLSKEFQNSKQLMQVKLLILVNSNLLCDALFQKVCDLTKEISLNCEIHQIHGLIPKSARKHIKDMKSAILIGTRAIDIGIDFDVPFLIFEASDRSSFMQRLGRGGRHNPCQYVAIVPTELKDKIELDQEKEKFDIEYLNHVCQITLREEELFYKFIFSNSANILTLFFLQALCNPYQICFNNDVKYFYELLSATIKYENEKITSFDKLCVSNVIAPCKENKGYYYKENPPITKIITEKIAFRGNLINIPAFFSYYKTWQLVPLHEISKMNFEPMTYGEIKKRLPRDKYAHITWRLNDNSLVLWVNSLTNKLKYLYLIGIGEPNKVLFTNGFDLTFQGNFPSKFREGINRIIKSLKPLPFIKVNSIFDWKIKYFREFSQNTKFSNLKYVLGEDAFLLQYIINR